jgi:hypothetical protein
MYTILMRKLLGKPPLGRSKKTIWDVNIMMDLREIRGCNQKFPDWKPGARTANGTALCH